jgi:DNA replication and repair protein RecF
LNSEQDNEETCRQNVQTLSLEDNMRNQWLEKFQNNREIDLARYQTTQGSHRDDFAFQINEMDARYYASQGQQRTCALSLKLTQLEKWAEHLEYSPILLLDDVCAELDLNRQKALFEFLPKKSQVFITTTHLSSLPPMPADKYQIINL